MDDLKRDCELWFDSLPDEDKRTVALNAIECLIEIQHIRFLKDVYDGSGKTRGRLYWISSGEDLRVPF